MGDSTGGPGGTSTTFGVSAAAPGDRHHLVTHRRRHLVALAIAVVLVDQVDLDVAHLGTAAQIVLPHQSVEVDRCGSAGVGLVVGDLGHLGEVVADLVQHPVGLLQRRALRHVEHHLELRLVVEGQHLEHHQLDRGERHRAGDQHRHREPQHAPARPPCCGSSKGLMMRRKKPSRRLVSLSSPPRGDAPGRLEHLLREPRRDHERHRQRDEHPHRRVDRDRAHVGAPSAGHESHRQ